MKITQSDLVEFINHTGNCRYNPERKEKYHKLGRRILKQLASMLDLKKGEYQISWNPGGIAVDGDHTLHTERFYLALDDNCKMGWFYWRTCQGMNDFAGGPNQIVHWPYLSAYGLDRLAETLRRVQYPLS
jgi:hypothetical protein